MHEALALAAGELVREADHLVAPQADLLEQRGDLASISDFEPRAKFCSGSPTMSRARMRGLSDE